MNLSSVATALGGEVSGRNTILCPGPRHSSRDRSLSVTFTGDDFTVFSHAGDDWRECKDHVRERLGLGDFTPVESRAVAIVTPMPVDRERAKRAGSLWREARPIEGTPANAYLASRGLFYKGEALRWHPSCPFGKGERHGCMIGMVRNIVTNEPQAIHRTAIDGAGRKIDRKAYGPIGGGAIKLTDDADVTNVIAVGEGIESSWSIRCLPDLEAMPVWSVLSANGIAAFPVLPGIETVWIAADNDASGTGQRASMTCAERQSASGVEAIILASTQAGADLNDKVAHHA